MAIGSFHPIVKKKGKGKLMGLYFYWCHFLIETLKKNIIIWIDGNLRLFTKVIKINFIHGLKGIILKRNVFIKLKYFS